MAALASLIGAGVALSQLRGPEDSRAAQSDKMKVIAGIGAANAAVFFARSAKCDTKKSCCSK